MKYLILCCLLLLSIVPLSCSGSEGPESDVPESDVTCEWRDVVEFSPTAYQIMSGLSEQTDSFSIKGDRLRIIAVFNFYNPASDEAISSGSFSIDVYHYPDMRLVETAVDETGIRVVEHMTKIVEVPVEKGMYCLYISSSAFVSWAFGVDECV